MTISAGQSLLVCATLRSGLVSTETVTSGPRHQARTYFCYETLRCRRAFPARNPFSRSRAGRGRVPPRGRLALAAAAPGNVARVRLTLFWERMRAQFGDDYAESVAKDQVLSSLGGRTVSQALADGEDVKVVWRAVCEAFQIPERMR